MSAYKSNPRWKAKRKSRKPKYLWSPEHYKAVVHGGIFKNSKGEKQKVIGLRKLAHGFDKKDGFDKPVEKWTKAQRARVRDYFHRVEVLQAQEKRIIKPRSEANLRKLQDAFHGNVPSKDFKVAFMPDTEPKVSAGFKQPKAKVRILKEGVSVERPGYERIFVPFNRKNLVRDARAEVERAAKLMPKAQLYFVQVGEFQSLTGMTKSLIADQILEWMSKYDGKKPLPSTSGNKGDNPKHHHWRYWLNGLVGYVIPKGHRNMIKMAKRIKEGREAVQDKNRELRNYMKRERVQAKQGKKISAGKAVKNLNLKGR